jgi:hypothetical protein
MPLKSGSSQMAATTFPLSDDYDPVADSIGSWEVAVAYLRERHLLQQELQCEQPVEQSIRSLGDRINDVAVGKKP